MALLHLVKQPIRRNKLSRIQENGHKRARYEHALTPCVLEYRLVRLQGFLLLKIPENVTLFPSLTALSGLLLPSLRA